MQANNFDLALEYQCKFDAMEEAEQNEVWEELQRAEAKSKKREAASAKRKKIQELTRKYPIMKALYKQKFLKTARKSLLKRMRRALRKERARSCYEEIAMQQ